MAADGTVTIKAILDAAGVTGGIRQIKQGLADVKDAASKVTFEELKTGGTNATALSGSLKSLGGTVTQHVTMPIAGMGAAIFKSASDFDTAASKMAASLNLPKETAEEFARIGQGIYTNGWGESLGEVNDALSYTAQTLKNTSGNTQEWQKDCEVVTQNALVMADVFGADVSESVRGTNALMEGFGLSAQEASDLMAAGMQRGLNYTDELGDNLSEYSVRWGEAGMSASQYFSLLEAGTANGAYNLDKVGDFLNEFLTSLSDGRMEAGIGAFSQGTQDVFRSFQNGDYALAQQMSDCCCKTNRNIDDLKYNASMNTAAINENTTAQVQKVLDAICQGKIEALQAQVSQLQMQNALCGVVRYPSATTYNAGFNPYFNGAACGCGTSFAA